MNKWMKQINIKYNFLKIYIFIWPMILSTLLLLLLLPRTLLLSFPRFCALSPLVLLLLLLLLLSLSLFSPCSLVLGGLFFGSRCGLLTTVDCCIEKIPLPIQMLKIFAKTLVFFWWFLLLLEFWFCGWMGRRGEICCISN